MFWNRKLERKEAACIAIEKKYILLEKKYKGLQLQIEDYKDRHQSIVNAVLMAKPKEPHYLQMSGDSSVNMVLNSPEPHPYVDLRFNYRIGLGNILNHPNTKGYINYIVENLLTNLGKQLVEEIFRQLNMYPKYTGKES